MRRAGGSKTMASKHFLPSPPATTYQLGGEIRAKFYLGQKLVMRTGPSHLLSTSTSVLFMFTQQEEYAAASDMLRTVSVDKTRE